MQDRRSSSALSTLKEGGGLVYPFLNSHQQLAELLEDMPNNAWRRDEDALAGLVLHLVKQGQAARAKSYMTAHRLEFEKTERFVLLDLLLALHLGDPVGEQKLASWRRLERTLPLTDPLLMGLYFNAMTAMHVRLGNLDEAIVAGQQSISCYREAGHLHLEHFVHVHLADVDVNQGRLREARKRLGAADRCLAQSGGGFGNEAEIIEVVRLAIDYERGRFGRVAAEAPRLRNSLVFGDSWSELFFQLARVGVLSTYFLEGRRAALLELEIYQADYARRHGGVPIMTHVIEAMIWAMEWHPGEVERILESLDLQSMHSALGSIMLREIRGALGDPDVVLDDSPRGEIVAELHRARRARGPQRRKGIERAMRLSRGEVHITPFVESRDAFLGTASSLAQARFASGDSGLRRYAREVLERVEGSYIVPEKLRALGFNHRQYRVASALQLGASNKQVARQLGISEATVKYHLTSLYKMTKTRRRSEIIEFMSENQVFANS